MSYRRQSQSIITSHPVLGMISNHMILNRDFKSSVWFLILILNHFVLTISILILKSFCAWFMTLNHQNLPANHRILQGVLQAAEQQLGLLRPIYFTDSSCSQSYLILECFYQNSFSYVIDCQFSHRETSCTVCRSCHPSVWPEHPFQQYVQLWFFTARCYASAVLAIAIGLCLCLSVCVCHKSEFY